jgi:serine/threonine protein kinase
MTPAPRIGTVFAGYRVEGLLGRGGMGVVYRAEHPRLGASVALKVMDPELAADEVFRERFVREARAAARIRHPNIIPIYDAGESGGDLYLAMRLIEGEDLRSLLRKQSPSSLQQTSVIGMQIASALDAAHRSGLIHRDVKPANILIEPGPDPDSAPIAYLADLGLTKQVETHRNVTGSGELLGTIDYIAPEQISGTRVDGRADVYSLACVLFECLTGTAPYVRQNQAAVLWAHLHDEVPRASALNPSLPGPVDEALARGMAKSPEERFATARELVKALQVPLETASAAARNGGETRPLQSPPRAAPTVTAPAGKRRSGRRALVLATALGAVLGGMGAAAVALLVSDDQRAAPRTSTEASPPGGTSVPRRAGLTPFDKELLRHVPDELQASCRHARPVTADFDATLSCRPGGVVSSLTYSHARSGVLLSNFFLSGMTRAGLPEVPADRQLPALTGLCSTGEIPAINMTVPVGLRGRTEVPEKVARDERLGLIRCYLRGGRARIEWTTGELGVYAVATGEDLGALYDWWRQDAGPEP